MPIPVVFHNMKGYDAHLIMQEIAEIDGDLQCIPNNMEKYISFYLGKLRFIDSFAFLLSSLDSLVSSNKPEDFEITKQIQTDPERLSFQHKKGVYPYEYMNSFEKFEERSLPPKEAFYSKLKKEDITDEDYEHAKKVWQEFDCETLGDFHDVYLATDTLLLADVFENFRKTCLKNYGLDTAHYYTSPGLSWDALLKYTSMELELLTDYNMYLFIEKGMRGGISTEMKRYCNANNPYLSDYDSKKEKLYILYLDANNLYGWAMSLHLPVGKFSWMRTMPTEETWSVRKSFITGTTRTLLPPESTQIPTKWMSPPSTSPRYRIKSREGQDKKAGPDPERQEELCPALLQSPAISEPRDEAQKGAQRSDFQPIRLDGAVHKVEH